MDTDYLCGRHRCLDHRVKQDRLGESNHLLETWTGRRLVGVEGTPLRVEGVSTVELQFAGEIFCCPVLIASSLTSEAILGLDFLEANKCTVDTSG